MNRTAAFLQGRTPAEWLVRVALAAVVLWFGSLAIAQSIALALPPSEAGRGYAIADDARVAGEFAERLSGAQATPEDRSRADAIARLALLRDPTVVDAVSTLGVNALVRGNIAEADPMLRYAETLSRRDLRSQMWAIEAAVARGDIPGALRHYDIALRAERSASDILFPVLAAAVSDAEVRGQLVTTLAQRPMWSGAFVDYVAAEGPDPVATGALFASLRNAGVPVAERARSAVIRALVDADRWEAAWNYYRAPAGADRRASRDPRFRAASDTPSPFDWHMVGQTGIATSIQRGEQGGVFDFAAPPGGGGLILQQLQMLPAGDYRLQGHAAGIDQPADSRPYWALSCDGGRELGRVDVASQGEGGISFARQIRVPADCPRQILGFFLRPSNDIAGVSGQIDFLQLSPLP